MPAHRGLFAAWPGAHLIAGCAPTAPAGGATDPASTDPGQGRRGDADRPHTMAPAHLKAVIVRVTVDGKEVVTEAVGESMTGVPATTDMHFRNGAVAISYVSTLLLSSSTRRRSVSTTSCRSGCPTIPHADQVTLGQLAQMTSGYADYVIGNTEDRTPRCTPTRSASGHPGAARATRRRSRCCTRRARTGTTPTPTTSSWAWPSRRPPARRCRSCCRRRCSARWG